MAFSRERQETLISNLNESHRNFVEAMIKGEAETVMIAYANYVIALGIILQATRGGPHG